MIPILFEKTETGFSSNGLGRLRDCISCIVTEERNGIYECDFEYPVDGAHYDLIEVGRIVGVTHDEDSDIQAFDIVSYTKPIDGIVSFHAVHISYRQRFLTVNGQNINSLADAFTLLKTATPENPFNYITDKTSTGYLGCADGIPKTVRQMLGGVEGSILDTYGGEYLWDNFNVYLYGARGKQTDFTIRYGVNMLDYTDETDTADCYSACVPYWTDQTETVVGDKQVSTGTPPSGREQCIPLDVSERFESKPTKAQVEAEGLAYISSKNTFNPSQSINVSFVRLQDMGEYAEYLNLLECNLCDTINVVFPEYNSSGQFKIVKTVWNVLTDKYDEMELGTLSMTLSEALGINSSYSGSSSGGGGGGAQPSTTLPKVNGTAATGTEDAWSRGDHVHPTDTTRQATLVSGTNIKTINSTSILGSGNISVLTSETDPIYSASPAASITSSDITDWNNKSDFSGSYTDLTNKPTIPTVYNATLTIQKNGSNINTFTANASSDVTANITVPTKVSELTNDSGYITGYTETDPVFSASPAAGITASDITDWDNKSDFSGSYNDLTDKPTIPTETSELINDSGYITSPNIPYCTCSTAAGTAAKTTTIVSGTFTADDLVAGAQVLVKFTNANTVASPTLKIGTTTAKAIRRYGTTAPSTSAASSWNAGAIVLFIYDGTYWFMENWLNTTYSSMTEAEITAGTGTTARTITPARLKLAIETWESVTSVNGSTGAVVLDAAAVGALPSTTTIPSKISDLTNDMVYDLGVVTPDASGIFFPTQQQIDDVVAMWNKGFCALLLTVNGNTYFAFKEEIITYNSQSFYGFVGTAAFINAQGQPVAYDILVGVSSLGYALFAQIKHITKSEIMDDVQTSLATKQDLLVSGTNIKTINNNSLLGSGNLTISGGTLTDVKVNNSSVVSGTVADINLKTINGNSVVGTGDISISGSGSKNIWYGVCQTSSSSVDKDVTTTTGDFYLADGNMVRVRFSNVTGQNSPTLNVDGTGKIDVCANGTIHVSSKAWESGEVLDFVYDSTNSVFLVSDGASASTTHYGKTWLNTSTSSTSTYEAATPSAVKAAYDLADGKQDELVSGTNIKTVNNNSLLGSGDISITASDVGALANTGGQVTGNVTLYTASGNSPALIFQRGTLTDNYNDWQIYDKSGFLYFAQRGQNSSAFADQVYFNTTGTIYATAFSGSGASLTSLNASNLTSGTVPADRLDLSGYVPTSRTVNGKALSSDITLSASDVSALPSSTVIPTQTSDLINDSGFITSAGVQTTSNLVTTLSNTSTDTEYPSAKCVYDYTLKTIIQAGGSSNISLTAGTMTKVPLAGTNVLYNNVNDVDVDSTNQALKIKTAGLYKIQGSVYIGSTTSSASSVGCFVRKGSNGVAFSSATEIQGVVSARAGTTDYTVHTPIKMFQLAVNDVIYLAGRVQGSTGTLSGANSSTFLYIERV